MPSPHPQSTAIPLCCRGERWLCFWGGTRHHRGQRTLGPGAVEGCKLLPFCLRGGAKGRPCDVPLWHPLLGGKGLKQAATCGVLPLVPVSCKLPMLHLFGDRLGLWTMWRMPEDGLWVIKGGLKVESKQIWLIEEQAQLLKISCCFLMSLGTFYWAISKLSYYSVFWLTVVACCCCLFVFKQLIMPAWA